MLTAGIIEPLCIWSALNTLLPVVAYAEAVIPPNLAESNAFEVVPLMVAFIVPSTVRSLWKWAEPDTVSDPEMFASNIFIWLYCYTLINTL